MSLAATCRRIKLLLSDVDGVMTDGGVTYDSAGNETKTFNIRDGLGIRLWQRAGGQFGVVTGRESSIVARRCAELEVTLLRQGVSDKLPVVLAIAQECGLTLNEVAYIGDDLPDLPAIRAVGFGVAVADAAEELLNDADYVTSLSGGRGAVRELVEVILKNSDRWEANRD
jgi:YrbI family 3-deoxy-D-manno-octulosonate 8-phosphate phosphatase